MEKTESEFNRNRATKDGLNAYCKLCDRERVKTYRLAHKTERNEHNKAIFAKRRELLSGLKRPCAKCGDSRSYVIDFHHIDPSTKKVNLARTPYTTDAILLAEVKKCVCMCRNCHQEYHHFYGTTPLEPVESLTEYLGRNPYEI